MTIESADDAQVTSFGDRMTEILNYGALNLAMGLGYRTGLFDAMDTFDTPRPVTDIAAAAGLDPRYVKEWLGVMVSGGIVEITRDTDGRDAFFLPPAHADVLTRRAGNRNLGVYTQEIPLLTECAMAAVFDGFYTGDGVPYEKYPDFQRFMTQLADAKHQAVLVDVFLTSVDGGRMLDRMKDGIRVCDVGCAEGVALMLMAEAFPESLFVGIDISPAAIQKAQSDARGRALENVVFHCMDVAAADTWGKFEGHFDYITAFDAIHDQQKPLEALAGVYHMLKPGGSFSMVDIAADSDMAVNKSHPMGAFLYTVSLMHCMPVGLVDGGAGLGMMWGRQQAEAMLKKAGFRDCLVAPVPEDAFNLHFFCNK